MDLMESVKSRMNGRSDLRYQPFEANGYGCCVLYLEGSIDLEMLQSHVFRPLQRRANGVDKDRWRRSLFDDLNLMSTPYFVTDNEDDMIAAMLEGKVVLTVKDKAGRRYCRLRSNRSAPSRCRRTRRRFADPKTRSWRTSGRIYRLSGNGSRRPI
ncbi:spore germination protein [Cohnella faecalis]|uniref:Uncharacterized protein n=1 Tax=Cohnella faecalis TaxID=2315694 RepID=A0A398CU74_9BACL|nr:spore germination protein [Cohnella faecalis]RIE02514.1 hypothetical protein D3H35_17645 [Cohnella faecalis]